MEDITGAPSGMGGDAATWKGRQVALGSRKGGGGGRDEQDPLTCPGTRGPRGTPATAAEVGAGAGPPPACSDEVAPRVEYFGSRDLRSS